MELSASEVLLSGMRLGWGFWEGGVMYEGGGSVDCVVDGEVVMGVWGVWGEEEECEREGGWASGDRAEVI